MGNETKREKYWSELSETEKIERIRTILKAKERFENEMRQLQGIVQDLRREIANHTHSDGKVCVPMSEYPKTPIGLGGVATLGSSKLHNPDQKPDEVYF